jgi:hypothetical protein
MHLIDQLLKDVIGVGSYSIQVIERRQALCFPAVLIRRRRFERILA